MTNVPAKPKRDSNTVRMNANQLTATRAQPNAIAVSRMRRVKVVASRQYLGRHQSARNMNEFSAVSFFHSRVRSRRRKIFRNTSHFQNFESA